MNSGADGRGGRSGQGKKNVNASTFGKKTTCIPSITKGTRSPPKYSKNQVGVIQEGKGQGKKPTKPTNQPKKGRQKKRNYKRLVGDQNRESKGRGKKNTRPERKIKKRKGE